MKSLILPHSLRDELKAPLGRLYRCKGLDCVRQMEDVLRTSARLIAVGDITAYYLLQAGFRPHLLIVDHQTKRAPLKPEVKEGIMTRGSATSQEYRSVNVINPAATLTGPFMDLIKDSLAGTEMVEIVVNGEEDLAALPAILYAPLGSAVIYGQPGEGSVLVLVTPKKKEEIKGIMNKMIVEEA
ncbi:MAG: hypothetical protein A4E45_00402 [Methanosaeta sp. PtaB.Bin039]|nr:MAG: hypothetical protein A4E45_00402 [Methanosaeta sp. PtaB.Bin039]OPY44477.1 MAG: hypothetical protein A4E47_01516 [Methanosaeta sp. PtaU1.Bin028]HOT07652.1 DUF359 domain-containing protein [Methanotrichaceae archaeon]HQF15928.1 DUF359 domain-containing protein [Methanotrichaceae archaeon]HQI90724.1 DUF359 domain-containing protein [Methanotrichaceae archaeon]